MYFLPTSPTHFFIYKLLRALGNLMRKNSVPERLIHRVDNYYGYLIQNKHQEKKIIESISSYLPQ